MSGKRSLELPALVGPDGNPIRVPDEPEDRDKPCTEHVQAMCDAFREKIAQAGESGVSMGSVLDALVQTTARVQAARGVHPALALQQVSGRFLVAYDHWMQAGIGPRARRSRARKIDPGEE